MNLQTKRIDVARAAWGESVSVDDRILGLLQRSGPQTLDRLALSVTGCGWAQVFLAVDRLSRSGVVLLRPAGRTEYLVSLKRSAAA